MNTLESLASSGALSKLPAISSAKLPAMYEAARHALAECSRIDECQAWADKAEAMASYAKQSKDDSLRKMADRIQARAIRRCGELLRQIGNDNGGKPKQNHDGTVTVSRAKAATEAGLSERQKVTALRVAAVPEPEFVRQVESDRPPTVTKLAEQGKKSLIDLGATRPRDFARATQALATLRRFAEFCEQNNAAEVAAGVQKSEASKVRAHVKAIDVWLDQFITRIEV